MLFVFIAILFDNYDSILSLNFYSEVSSNNETTANKTGQKKKAKPSASPLKQEMKNNQDATVTSKTDAKASLATKSWHESSSFLMNNLEAHNDLVVCVDFDEDFVISGR